MKKTTCLLCGEKDAQLALFAPQKDFRAKYQLPKACLYGLCAKCRNLPADLRNAEVENAIVRAYGGEMSAEDMLRSVEGTRKYAVS